MKRPFAANDIKRPDPFSSNEYRSADFMNPPKPDFQKAGEGIQFQERTPFGPPYHDGDKPPYNRANPPPPATDDSGIPPITNKPEADKKKGKKTPDPWPTPIYHAWVNPANAPDIWAGEDPRIVPLLQGVWDGLEDTWKQDLAQWPADALKAWLFFQSQGNNLVDFNGDVMPAGVAAYKIAQMVKSQQENEQQYNQNVKDYITKRKQYEKQQYKADMVEPLVRRPMPVYS